MCSGWQVIRYHISTAKRVHEAHAGVFLFVQPLLSSSLCGRGCVVRSTTKDYFGFSIFQFVKFGNESGKHDSSKGCGDRFGEYRNRSRH